LGKSAARYASQWGNQQQNEYARRFNGKLWDQLLPRQAFSAPRDA
jgi:protein gp37